MTQSTHNPLAQELAAAPMAGAHADLDVLTAFAEGTLPLRERGDLLAHLASCADCRELLHVAQEGQEERPTQGKLILMNPPSRAALKQWLTWSGIAAAIVIACGTGVILWQRYELTQSSTIGRQSVVDSSSTATQAAPDQPGSLHETPPRSTTVSPNVAFAGAEPSHIGNQQAARPRWRINAQGQAERSIADGVWETALPNKSTRMHVIAVLDDEVWIGGDDSHLYRSTDDGTSWKAIGLPNKGTGAHSVAHIRFRTEQIGVVEAADGTEWTTSDGGATWH